MAEQVYIRVPVMKPGNQLVWEYIPVVADQLYPGILTEFFVRRHMVAKRGGGFEAMPSPLGLVQQSFSTSELTGIVQRVLEEWETGITACGEDGQRLWEETLRTLPWEALVKAMAQGRANAAETSLEEILYGLLSVTCDLAQQLATLRRERDTARGAVDTITETFVQSEAVTQGMLLDWASEADQLVQSALDLQTLERLLYTAREDIERTGKRLRALLQADAPLIAELTLFLEGTATSKGFLVSAYAGRNQPAEGQAELTAQKGAAAELLGRFDRYCNEVSAQWESLRTSHAKIHDLPSRVRQQVQLLTSAAAACRDYLRRFKTGTARPYDLPDMISREDYEHAEVLLRDAEWSPGAVTARLQSLVMSTLAMLEDQPTIGPDLAYSVQQAKGALSDLTSVAAPVAQLVPRHEARSPQFVAVESGTAPIVRSNDVAAPQRPSANVDADRATRLYQLVCTVGYVLTCKFHHFAQSNIRAMLEILAYLELCTSAEIDTYFAAVTELSKADGEREVLTDTAMVSPRWRKSKCRWLQYQIRGRWGLKLTKSQEAEGARALVAFGIDADKIRAAREQRSTDREEAFNAKRAEEANRVR